MVSTVAWWGRAAPALLRWATFEHPGVCGPLGGDVDGAGHSGRIYWASTTHARWVRWAVPALPRDGVWPRPGQ